MLPSSHPEPIFAGADGALRLASSALLRPVEASTLADAFSEFIDASARLEASYRDLQGEVAELGRELAERNAALKMSRNENERMRVALEQIVASMPCGVLVLDGAGQIAIMNPEAARLLDLKGAAVRNLQEIGARTQLDLAALSAIEGEQEFCAGSGETRRWIEMRTRRTQRAGGTARDQDHDETILIFRDTTMHKQAEQEREAGRRAMALAEIAATLAHEIRNPLASLELFAGLIAEDAAPDAQGGRMADWVQHLRAGIRSLGGTVNNVLSFHGNGAARLTPLALGPAIASAVAFVQPIAAQAGIALGFRSHGEEVTVLGNASALGQVVLNLVTNAVRHTPTGGNITVSLLPAGAGRVTLQVADSGCGIAPAQLPELFRAGFSGCGSRSGLGLAVCQQIAAQHGGGIDVESTQGSGATFRMELATI